jgi:hypothetical protein
MMLRKGCQKHSQLPPSYVITDELTRIGEYPSGGGGNADVWRGVYRGSEVAIKVLRINQRVDLVKLERVRPFALFRSTKTWCVPMIRVEILPRSGPVEAIQTPKPISVGGHEKTSRTLMMISEWMEYGTVMDFITSHPEANRLKLVSILPWGLKQTPVDISSSVGRCCSWTEVPP